MSHHYKTIVISDLHLGVKASKAKEVVRFLKTHTCDTLILNGDIIDGWQLRKSGKWKKKHSKFFKLILKMMKDKKMQIIYLRGNHDDFLDEIMPFEIGNFCIKNEHILLSGSKKYLVIHGDLFDAITTKLKWLSKLGDVGYTFLLWLNRHYNHYRVRKGLPYYSLSQVVKQKVKSAVSFISAFENELAAYAKNRNCQGVITGHIHQAADKMLGDIHYLNSGDWVESLTALAETHDHHWRIITYSESVMSKSKLKEEIENLLTENPYNHFETA
ncbi:MAG: UDP-2,3-diacylglucosamine diphosphatase [Bacteroidota bacterium]|jgi:UDP-2,3-diacylglucosamine pyrophosphatase LpxH